MADGLVIYAKARAFKARAKKIGLQAKTKDYHSWNIYGLLACLCVCVCVCVCLSAMCVLAHR